MPSMTISVAWGQGPGAISFAPRGPPHARTQFLVIDFAAVTDPAAALEVVVKQNLPKSPTYRGAWAASGLACARAPQTDGLGRGAGARLLALLAEHVMLALVDEKTAAKARGQPAVLYCLPPAALHPFIGEKSLAVSGGETWSRLRKAFNPAFTTQASSAVCRAALQV